MVPQTLWHNNLRYLLKAKKWQEIRQHELKRVKDADYRFRCEVCSRAKDSLDCHEIWDYNESDRIQTLEGLTMLCKQCHLIKHIGFSTHLAMEGQCNFPGLIRHFCQVNNKTPAEFYEHYLEEYARWEERSKYNDWKQDLKYIINHSYLTLF